MYTSKTVPTEGKAAATPAAAAPLTIGAVHDPLETEAEAMADTVMRMPAPTATIQRKCAECEEEDAVQRKPVTSFVQKKEAGSGGSASAEVSSSIQATKGGGSPLGDNTKTFMESRFGADFSGVRVHTGSYAAELSDQLQAQAFTVGNDIYFNSGKYAPESSGGQHLLAHELTHTLQQGSSQGIQRTISVDPGVNLDTMGFTVTHTGDTYTAPAVTKSSVHNEIFSGLLHSPRNFKLKGSTSAAANSSLQQQIRSRLGIVSFAAKKKYTFGAGAAFRMNPAYWNNDVTVKPGVDRQTAIEDLNVNPTEYSIACLAATMLTMEGGSKSPLTDGSSADTTDWIPGDWGYITNTKFPPGGQVGLEGENIIYVGKDQFWGHFGPGLEYKTLKQWFDQVKSWHGGASIDTQRTSPTAGLE